MNASVVVPRHPEPRSPRSRLVARRLAAAATAFGLFLLGAPFVAPAQADPTSPLTVTNVATPSPATSGGEIIYTITAVNTGGSKVTNLVLADQLNGVGTLQSPPAAPQYAVTSSQGTCTQSAQLVTCNGGVLAGGASWTVTIRGLVNAPSGSTINNTATITGTRSAQNFTTSTGNQTLVQGGSGSSLPDLSLNKTGPSSVVAGANFDYTLTVNNLGSANATGITVADTLPAGVTMQTAPFGTTSLFVCSFAGSPITVTCTGGAVNAGQNGTITLHVVAPASGPLTNTAVVDPANTIAEGNELNNTSATVNTSVTAPPAPNPLTIVKTDDPTVIAGAGPDPVAPLETLTYKIRVTNAGTTRADDVTVVDGTQGLEAASIVASQVIVNGTLGTGYGCTVAAPQVTCRIRSLNPGGTLTITVTGKVIAPAGTALINTATATANVKNTGVTASATEQTTVRPAVDLGVTKSGAPDPVCASSWPSPNPADVCTGGLVYTITVGNSGIRNASNVLVRDVLPPGTIYDRFANVGGADFSCALKPGNVLECTNPLIGPASTETFTITLVAPPTTGSLSNTVTVDPNNTIFEADETNNTATTTVQVRTGIDLTLFKYDSPGPAADPAGTIPAYPNITQGVDPIATNGTQYYTIYVDNLGTQDATNVRVEDTLPAGTVFLGATADQGFSCSYAAGKVTCVGGHLLGTESEFYANPAQGIVAQGNQFATITIRVFATNAVQPAMHNEVRVDPLGEIAEVNEANNLAVQDTVVTVGGSPLNAFNQLTIVKTQADPASGPIATNGRTTYLLHVGNDGTDPVSTVVVKDTLPSGARFVSAVDAAGASTDSFACSHDGSPTGGVVTCSAGALSGSLNVIPGVPTSRDILVTFFAPNVPGTYTNVAKVDPDNLVPEGNEFDNQASAPVVIKTAGDGGQNSVYQLTIAKTATPIVSTSSVITYTLTVANAGTDPAFGVVAKDVLPAGTTFISAADTVPGANQFTCSASAGVVLCTGATLGGTNAALSTAATSRQITVKAFAPTQPGTITNNAFVDPDNTIPEGDETDNHASADTKVVVGSGYIDLTVSKCDGGGACPTNGNTVYTDQIDHYTVTAKNLGTDPAFQVVVRDVLPAGATFVSATDVLGGNGAFLCDYAAGVVTCTGGTLDGSAGLIPGMPTSRDIDIAIKVPNVDNLPITNQVFIDPANAIAESNETNNQASDTSVVHSPFDVSVDKTGPSTAHQNDTEDYVITVTNMSAGGRSLTGVVVVDSLPVGLIPLGVVAGGDFQCQTEENPVNKVSCVGDLGPGESVKITVHVFITQDGGELDNQACADPANAIVEFDETNNCSTKATQIVTFKPDISVHKAVDKGAATTGETLRYTITASNIGDAPADPTSFTIKDTLPGVVSYVGSDADNGTTCTHDGSPTGGVVTCTPGPMGVGATSTIHVDVTVLDTATTAFTNSATVDGSVQADSGTEPCVSQTCAGETITTNNSSSVTVSSGSSAIDLVMGAISDNPDPVPVGSVVVYTATVTNGGTAPALTADGNQVVVRFTVPSTGVVVGIPTASQGFLCTKATGVVTCTGDLAAGASTTVTIPITPQPASPLLLTVTGTVDPLGAVAESNEANNSATQTTTVSPSTCLACKDLVMGQIIATPNPIPNGTDVTYQLVVTNIGDQAAVTANPSTDVLLAIDLDRNANESHLVSVSATGALTCQANPLWGLNPATQPEIICTAPAGFAPGQGSLVTVVAHAATAVLPSYVDLDASADPGHLVAEFNEANNDGTLRVDTVAP